MNPKTVSGKIYHLLNRGVDKRKIFLDKEDHLRFIHDLFEFNDANPVADVLYTFTNTLDIGRPKVRVEREPRKILVDILAFVLMPNHYHLLVVPRQDSAVSLFMKKLNMGYAKYFNEKYDRSGALFQGKYKCVAIERDAHFIYIHWILSFRNGGKERSIIIKRFLNIWNHIDGRAILIILGKITSHRLQIESCFRNILAAKTAIEIEF